VKKIWAFSLGMLVILSLITISSVSNTVQYKNNALPIADAGGPYQALEGEVVSLDASNSIDPDSDSLQYRWDLDDDGIWDTNWSSSSTLNHVWSDDYSGNISLEVTDEKGQEEWTRESGVRVPIDGIYTYPDYAIGPDVLELDDGTYRMYYTQLYGPIYSPSGSLYGNILSAASNDGLSWFKESGVRVDFGDAYDAFSSFTPEVIALQNGTFRMYYTGAIPGAYQILSAFSFDSFSWTKESGIRIPNDSTHVTAGFPNIVVLPSGEYRTYYHGYNIVKGQMEILSAFSYDGLQWIKEGIRLLPGGPDDPIGVHCPEVVTLPSGSYRMFYTANDGVKTKIFSAISDDGLVWTKENKVIIDNVGPFDSHHTSSPDIVEFPNGTVRMYYMGFDGNNYNVLSAIQSIEYSTSKDSASVKIGNIDPSVAISAPLIEVDFSIRVSGSKWSNVNLTLYEEDIKFGFLEVERWPGYPADNPSVGTINSTLNMSRQYKAIVTYDPYPDNGDPIEGDQGNNGKDKKDNAGNPVWLILMFADGSEIKIKHTFNTEQSKIRNSEKENHIEPWELEINSLLVGQRITLIARAMDLGSDDLGFHWNFLNTAKWYNNDGSTGVSPSDPYPSPEGIYPFEASDVMQYQYSGPTTLKIKVMDDDGGEKSAIIDFA
jgi:predicted GH43/DUF377 family glycosyl hydrolase